MTPQTRQARLTVLSLAVGAFAIAVSEFATMGLLPYYAKGLGVTEPVAGHAVSAYALGVVIGAPILAVLGARLPRRLLLMLLIGTFSIANLAGAFAPGIGWLVTARVIAGLPHGAFLGIAMLVAANAQPKERRAAGVAQVMLGLTIANVIGVPAAGAVGQAFGWRTCFVLVAAIGLISVMMIGRFVPKGRPDLAAGPLQELGAFANRAVWLTLLVGAIGFGGIFAVYSYFSAALIQAAHTPAWAIPLALSAFGIGATIGTPIAGRLASWSIFGGAAIAFAASLWLVRSQVTVGDTSYMRAMIPHHSIAIMTSSRANISDPRVRKLADEIIYAQDKEIAEMRYLINSIEASGDASETEEQSSSQIVSLDQALSTAHVAVLDAGFLTEEDIAALFPAGATCTFNYTTGSPPSLAIGEVDGQATGLVKLSGDLVRLVAVSDTVLSTEGLTINIGAPGTTGEAIGPIGPEPSEADMSLKLDAGLTAGYRGFYNCRG